MGQDVAEETKAAKATNMIQPRNRSSYIDQVNPFTNNVFQEAVMRGDCAIVSVLLKYGIHARRNQRNAQGLTALQQAVFDGNMRLAVKLLEAGADIEAKTANEWTSLHIAAAVGEYEILCMLIANCAELIALTKNEELPIDLACNREIKVKLAQEMSRIGYSELATWYMRKLAAREGTYYVISADALLDVACYNNESSESGSAFSRYSYPVNTQSLRRNTGSIREYSGSTKYNSRQKVDDYSQTFSRNSSTRASNSSSNNTSLSKPYSWYLTPSTETMTYLSCSSGYLSEVIFNPSTGEYTQVNKSSISSNIGSPKRTLPTPTTELKSSKSLLSVNDDSEAIELAPRSNTLRRTSSSQRKNMELPQNERLQRKPSKIELFIDYSIDTDEDAADANSNANIYASPVKTAYTDSPISPKSPKTPSKSSIDSYPKSVSSYDSAAATSRTSKESNDRVASYQTEVTRNAEDSRQIPPSIASSVANSSVASSPIKQSRNTYAGVPSSGNLPYDSRAVNRNSSFKNVRFTGDVDSNEYCNCPNCKKMGYALSPDLRDSQRRGRQELGSVQSMQPMQSPKYLSHSNSHYGYQYCPTNEQGYLVPGDYYPKPVTGQYYCEPGCDHYKPRKRKKNLLSGIMNIFKDTIKIQRSSSETDLPGGDSGIVFAVALRDKSKSKAIKQRNKARRSNSFSGSSGEYVAQQHVARSKSFTSNDPSPTVQQVPQPRYHDDMNYGMYYSMNSGYPVIPNCDSQEQLVENEIDNTVVNQNGVQTENDSARGTLSHTATVSHTSNSQSCSELNYENMRKLPYANYADKSRTENREYWNAASSSGSHHAESIDAYETQSMASDARINSLMSADISTSVHGEVDHDCDFCAAVAAVQGRGGAKMAMNRGGYPGSYNEHNSASKMFCST